ncbi:MAG: hypothetical protein ACI9VR_002446 [Cognaticolwellia sp.]|jgi:hypothetical protein
MSLPRLSAAKRWSETLVPVLSGISMMASATLASGARITPMPWVTSSSLRVMGSSTYPLNGGCGVMTVSCEGRGWNLLVVPGERLPGA